MASYTLFDKPHFPGIKPNSDLDKKTTVAAPVSGVEWQVLTANGLRMSCTTFTALRQWKHPQTPLAAVSHNGEGWRSFNAFRNQLDRGVRPEIAIEQTPWLGETDK